MKQSPDFVARTVSGDLVLVPVARQVSDLESVFTLNPVGARIWALVEECPDLQSIAARLTEEYDVDDAQALADVQELVAQLKQVGALID